MRTFLAIVSAVFIAIGIIGSFPALGEIQTPIGLAALAGCMIVILLGGMLWMLTEISQQFASLIGRSEPAAPTAQETEQEITARKTARKNRLKMLAFCAAVLAACVIAVIVHH